MDDKELLHIGGDTIKQLLDKANERGITKEQFLQILEVKGNFILVYYG